MGIRQSKHRKQGLLHGRPLVCQFSSAPAASAGEGCLGRTASLHTETSSGTRPSLDQAPSLRFQRRRMLPCKSLPRLHLVFSLTYPTTYDGKMVRTSTLSERLLPCCAKFSKLAWVGMNQEHQDILNGPLHNKMATVRRSRRV